MDNNKLVDKQGKGPRGNLNESGDTTNFRDKNLNEQREVYGVGESGVGDASIACETKTLTGDDHFNFGIRRDRNKITSNVQQGLFHASSWTWTRNEVPQVNHKNLSTSEPNITGISQEKKTPEQTKDHQEQVEIIYFKNENECEDETDSDSDEEVVETWTLPVYEEKGDGTNKKHKKITRKPQELEVSALEMRLDPKLEGFRGDLRITNNTESFYGFMFKTDSYSLPYYRVSRATGCIPPSGKAVIVFKMPDPEYAKYLSHRDKLILIALPVPRHFQEKILKQWLRMMYHRYPSYGERIVVKPLVPVEFNKMNEKETRTLRNQSRILHLMNNCHRSTVQTHMTSNGTSGRMKKNSVVLILICVAFLLASIPLFKMPKGGGK